LNDNGDAPLAVRGGIEGEHIVPDFTQQLGGIKAA
jgi:hypothetical protein